MIEGVRIEPRKIFPHEKGDVMHMLRADEGLLKKFGEIYFSFVNPGFFKGWKKHLRQTQHFVVPVGEIKLVLYDDRASSRTKGQVQEIEMGRTQYCLVRIPPEVWYGFQAVGHESALIVNCTDIPHDSAEAVNIEITDPFVPYVWDLAKR